MRLCAIVSMLAVVLSLAGLSLAGDGSPKRSDEAETAKKPPQFEATDWTQRPDLADARAGGCAGRVRKGAVTVSSTDGEVEYMSSSPQFTDAMGWK